MEYIYSALLLHKGNKAVDEGSLESVLKAAGIKADNSRIKAVVAALEGVNIDEVISQASLQPVATATTPSATESPPEKKEKPKEEEKKEEEVVGLGALFG